MDIYLSNISVKKLMRKKEMMGVEIMVEVVTMVEETVMAIAMKKMMKKKNQLIGNILMQIVLKQTKIGKK
jgi:hypothetical protein